MVKDILHDCIHILSWDVVLIESTLGFGPWSSNLGILYNWWCTAKVWCVCIQYCMCNCVALAGAPKSGESHLYLLRDCKDPWFLDALELSAIEPWKPRSSFRLCLISSGTVTCQSCLLSFAFSFFPLSVTQLWHLILSWFCLWADLFPDSLAGLTAERWPFSCTFQLASDVFLLSSQAYCRNTKVQPCMRLHEDLCAGFLSHTFQKSQWMSSSLSLWATSPSCSIYLTLPHFTTQNLLRVL